MSQVNGLLLLSSPSPRRVTRDLTKPANYRRHSGQDLQQVAPEPHRSPSSIPIYGTTKMAFVKEDQLRPRSCLSEEYWESVGLETSQQLWYLSTSPKLSKVSTEKQCFTSFTFVAPFADRPGHQTDVPQIQLEGQNSWWSDRCLPYPDRGSSGWYPSLSPLLFIIVLDYILHQSIKDDNNGLTLIPEGVGHVSLAWRWRISILDYADDQALISASQTPSKKPRHSCLLCDLETTASTELGLHVNASKTEFMVVNIGDPDPVINSLDGSARKQVQDFKYLGSYITDRRKDFETRKGMVWTLDLPGLPLTKLQNIRNSMISSALKLKFCKACIEPVLLYGSETWTINKAFQIHLDGSYTHQGQVFSAIPVFTIALNHCPWYAPVNESAKSILEENQERNL